MSSPLGTALPPRISAKIQFAEDSCCIWTGGIGSDGYPILWFEGKSRRAHKWLWKFHNGPVPDGLWVLHRCDTPACVNWVKCLWIGTPKENSQDRNVKKRNADIRGVNNPQWCGGISMSYQKRLRKEGLIL